MTMPTALLPFSLLFFALCMAVSLFIQQRATAALSPEESARSKAALFAPLRWLLIAVGSLGAFCFILAPWPDRPSWLFQGFLLTSFIALVAFTLLGLHRLSHLRLPATYIRQVWMGQVIYLLGVLAMGYGTFSILGSVQHP